MTGPSKTSFGFDDPATHVHLGFVQGIITRLAGNSAAVKTWCAAVIAGLLAVGADGLWMEKIVVALIVCVAFMFLDGFYLSLERDYRRIYGELLDDLNATGIPVAKLFALRINKEKEKKRRLRKTVRALGSFSIWPFYGVLVVGLALLALGNVKWR